MTIHKVRLHIDTSNCENDENLLRFSEKVDVTWWLTSEASSSKEAFFTRSAAKFKESILISYSTQTLYCRIYLWSSLLGKLFEELDRKSSKFSWSLNGNDEYGHVKYFEVKRSKT